MIILSIFLIALGTLLLAVKSRKDLKALKMSSLIVIGIILISIGTWLKDTEFKEQSENVKKNNIALKKFDSRLDSVLTNSKDSEIELQIENLKIDYENWASGIVTDLQIREFTDQQQIAKQKADQLTNRKPVIENFKTFITSIKNYSNAYNQVSNDTIGCEFLDIDGVDNESFGLIMGNYNTYVLTFQFTKRLKYLDNGEIILHRLQNSEFNEFENNMNSTDTIQSVLNYQIFKLKLTTRMKMRFKFDPEKKQIQVNEYNNDLRNKIFESIYDLNEDPRVKIDLMAKKLMEEILYAEKTKIKV